MEVDFVGEKMMAGQASEYPIPLEIEPSVVQGRETCEVANGRRARAGRSSALDGQASRSTDNQFAQG